MKKLFNLLFVLASVVAYAQNADENLTNAEKAFADGAYELAIPAYQTAAQSYKTQQQWEKYAKCGVGWGNSLLRSGNADAALKVFDDFLAATATATPNEQIAFLNKGKGAVYYSKNNYLEAETYLKKALEIRQQLNPNNPDLLRDYSNLGMVSRLSNNFGAADTYSQQALGLIKKIPIADIPAIQIVAIYENLGVVAMNRGFYEEALNYFDAALAKAHELPFQQMTLLINKAKIFQAEKNPKEALRELKMAMTVYKNNNSVIDSDPKGLANLADLYAILGFNWAIEHSIDSANYYFLKAIDLADPKNKVDYIGKLATAFYNTKDIERLKVSVEQARNYLTEVPALSGTAAYYFEMESGYQQLIGDYDAALRSNQQQIAALIEDYEPSDKLPTEQQTENTISLDYLQNAVAAKARILYNAYKAGKGGEKELEKALEALFLFDKLIVQLRQQSNAEGTGLAWSNLTLDAYANALDVCWELWQTTKNEQYKNHAFYFSEKSKAMLLLDAFQKSKATQLAGVPNDKIEFEKRLKLNLSATQRQLYQAQQDVKAGIGDAQKVKDLENAVFALKTQHEQYLKTLEKEYPKYYSLRHNNQVTDIAQVRTMLAPDQALMEYFVADSSVYLFKITTSATDWYRLSIKEEQLTYKVRDMRQSIYNYYLGADRSEEMLDGYNNLFATTATNLYQELLAPAAPLPRRLLIIPANALGDLPFEALLTEKPQNNAQYKQHAYLLRKHITAYCYSATLLSEMRQRQHAPTQGTLLAFAPEFGKEPAAAIRGERFTLSPLVFNAVEVDNIAKIISNNQILKNENAVESKFHELASQYRILHFATHGMANDRHPDYSFLAFTEITDTTENEYLYVNELYNTELNADLVVLSACETGIGKLYRGEGIVSLARGFSYAGAKGIFTTLWSVNDQATSTIIESFYKYLAQGKDKDEALFLAKNDYLDGGNNATAHPFLWAPYIFVGDTQPLQGIGGGTPIWAWIAGGAGLLAAVAFFFSRRRKE